MKRFFVTATDTGVGKTEVACALLRGLSKQGRAFAFKPAESGGTGDARRLRAAAGSWQRLEEVCLYRLRAPLAPAIAAREEGRSIELSAVMRQFRRVGSLPGVVEGAGGLLVPFANGLDVVDLIEALRLPVVLVARAGLGTINHTALSLELLRSRKLKVAAVLLSASAPSDPSVPFNQPELTRRYPQIPMLGPVPFLTEVRARRRAMDAAVAPLLE